MTKTILSLAVLAAFAGSAFASRAPGAIALQLDAPALTVAKNGADDPAGDDRGGHGPGHKATLAKNGADDPAGDDRGGHGPGHKATLA